MLKKILIARPLPDAVLDAARADFDVDVRDSTAPLSDAEMRAALRDYDGVMPTLGDQFSAEVFADVPDARCKILANFGVGYNHIDAAAAQAAGIVVSNTPGAVTDATADIAMTLMLMGRVASDANAGSAPERENSWHRGYGAHRASDRTALPLWFRDAGCVFQPLPQRSGI